MILNAVGKSSGSIAVGANTSISSDKPCIVTAITLVAGSAASTLTIQDGTGGTVQWKLGNAATDSTAVVSQYFSTGLHFSTSCYATVAGTAATAFISYQYD